MKISEVIKETASSGGTSSGSIAVNTAIPDGQFFGGDPAASIYPTIKKNRKKRKEVILGRNNEK